MKKLIILLEVLIMLVTIFVYITPVYAENYAKTGDFDTTNADMQGKAKTVADKIVGAAVTVTRIAAVITALLYILVLAMRFMLAAPGDRADVKKAMVPYTIGAIVIFGATGILSVISKISETIK